MVSTHLKNISQIGLSPQVGVKIKNVWNHQLVYNRKGKSSSQPPIILVFHLNFPLCNRRVPSSQLHVSYQKRLGQRSSIWKIHLENVVHPKLSFTLRKLQHKPWNITLPSKKLTYPTKGEVRKIIFKFKMPFLMGYVSSLEGIPSTTCNMVWESVRRLKKNGVPGVCSRDLLDYVLDELEPGS